MYKAEEKVNIDDKLAMLDRIYAVYEDFIAKFDWACRKYCADCCTCNVTATTLEGYKIAHHWMATGQPDRLERVRTASSPRRFQPQTTFNGLAEYSLQDDELPEEDCDPAWGACPFLTDAECPIYGVRPFGCRCLISEKKCKETGYAVMDPFILTVNHVFLQVIEHFDANGFSGNLTDVLLFMTSTANRQRYTADGLNFPPAGLIANRPLRVLMVPPEHRSQIRPILNALYDIQI